MKTCLITDMTCLPYARESRSSRIVTTVGITKARVSSLPHHPTCTICSLLTTISRRPVNRSIPVVWVARFSAFPHSFTIPFSLILIPCFSIVICFGNRNSRKQHWKCQEKHNHDAIKTTHFFPLVQNLDTEKYLNYLYFTTFLTNIQYKVLISVLLINNF